MANYTGIEPYAEGTGTPIEMSTMDNPTPAAVPPTQEESLSVTEIQESPTPNVEEINNVTSDVEKTVDDVYNESSALVQMSQQMYEANQAQQKALAQGLGGTGSPQQALVDYYQQRPDADYQGALTAAQQQYGVPGLMDKVGEQNIKVAQLKSDIDRLDIEELAEIDRQYARKASMTTIEAEISEIEREYRIKKAYKSADLAAEAALLQAYGQNLENAQKLVDQAVDLYTLDIQDDIQKFDNLFNVYSDWVNTLHQDEKDILYTAREDLIREEKYIREDYTTKLNLLTDAAAKGVEMGVGFEQIKDMDLEEVVGLYMKKVPAVVQWEKSLDIESKQLANLTSQLKLASLKNELAIGKPIEGTGSVGEAFNLVANNRLFSTDEKLMAQNTFLSYLEAGDVNGAKNQIEVLAVRGLGVTEAGKYMGRQALVDKLQDISSLISDYEASGGDMNVLKGTEQEIIEKVGEVGDPELAGMANRIKNALYDYRNSLTGAQFSEKEAESYEELFPSTGKTAELNMAKIKSLQISSFVTNNSYLKSSMGQDVYNEVFGEDKQAIIDSINGGYYNVYLTGQ